jgi:tetratricopeptide (TPR) repeat protein
MNIDHVSFAVKMLKACFFSLPFMLRLTRLTRIARIHKNSTGFHLRQLATLPSEKELSAQTAAQKVFNEGLEKWNREDLVGAQSSFEKSIQSFPTSDAYFNLANVFHTQGMHDKAIEYWKKSLELGERADAHVNIANVMAIFQRNAEGALPHYEKALELSPEDPEINYNFGVVLDSCGKLEKAIEQYSIAVSWGLEQAEKNLRNARARWVSQEFSKE